MSLKKINLQINKLKKKIKNIEGTECEVYSRIVGYYRSVKNWNPGRKAEYKKRKGFQIKEEK